MMEASHLAEDRDTHIYSARLHYKYLIFRKSGRM